MNLNILKLLIRDREKILFQGEVNTLTATNEVGKFDVLPRHSNFISLVNGVVSYRQKGSEAIDIEVSNGVIKVEKNNVEVYLGFKK